MNDDTADEDNLDRIAEMASDYIDAQVDYDLPPSFGDGATPLDHDQTTRKLTVGYFDGQEATKDLLVEFKKLSYTDHYAVRLAVRNDTESFVLVRREDAKPLAEQVINLQNAIILRQDRDWPN